MLIWWSSVSGKLLEALRLGYLISPLNALPGEALRFLIKSDFKELLACPKDLSDELGHCMEKSPRRWLS